MSTSFKVVCFKLKITCIDHVLFGHAPFKFDHATSDLDFLPEGPSGF